MPLLRYAKRGVTIESLNGLLLLMVVLVGLSSSSVKAKTTQGYPNLSKDFNTMLVAELYHNLGESKRAVSHYSDLALESDDPKIARRATEIAARSSQLQRSLQLVKRWIFLSPNSLDARQYHALLLLRDNQFNESAEQLAFIYQLHEARSSSEATRFYSNGLKFIGAMLSVESHHNKALNAFSTYLELYKDVEELRPYKEQLYLIQATLAEKAKKHRVVLTAIRQYEIISKNEQYADKLSSNGIIVMKVKALKALSRFDDAVYYLRPIIDKKKGSDSLQLELVRLLIQNKQKFQADPYLENLVFKHPDNNDLRKSLIALEIDQKELVKARRNILELEKSQAFKNDALYFLAEITEAEGDLIGALESYQKVKAGSLLGNAKGKIARLRKILDKQNMTKTKVNYKGVK